VDRLLYRSSEGNRYATLFVGVYDDAQRRLRYVNCGHLPPFVLRANGEAERLWPTAPVLGLLEHWDCVVAETTLGPGDILAIFSDGMCEAFSDDGEEFGEERLCSLMAANRDLPLGELVDVTIAAVRTFSGAEQEDDQTIVVARCLQATAAVPGT
jgi:phosphoserine phosphatase RsbU/P